VLAQLNAQLVLNLRRKKGTKWNGEGSLVKTFKRFIEFRNFLPFFFVDAMPFFDSIGKEREGGHMFDVDVRSGSHHAGRRYMRRRKRAEKSFLPSID